MLERREGLTRIKNTGLVAILRRAEAQELLPVVDALLEGGVDCVELPMSVSGGIAVFPQIREHYGDRICLGAGGVFNADLATLAIRLDVDFISAPSSDPAIVDVCRHHNVVAFPGAMTPTEIIAAWHFGADLIKVFPADLVGPGYFTEVLTQLADLPLVATGGVTEQNLAGFMQAGALAAVVGRGVVGHPDDDPLTPAEVTARARRLRDIVESCR